MPISKDDVAYIAELANLELSPAEHARMLQDLNSILSHIGQLNELDTGEVAPMAQGSEQLAQGSASDPSPHPLRADQIAPSLDRAQVLASAPDTDGVFFKVPKVIER
jgi:aspartyl-tRNA(Asn)/glutamyl-tRNA(Gln) amidotransferase subunit C